MSGADDLFVRLRELDPVDPDELRGAGATPPARALLHSILAPAQAGAAAPRRQSARRWLPSGLLSSRRWALAPVAAAAAFGLTVVLGLPGGVGGGDQALAALDTAAATAAATPAPERPYVTEARSTSLGTVRSQGRSWQVYRTEVRRERVAAERGAEGWVRVTAAPPKFLDPSARAAWEAAGEPDFRTWSESFEDELTATASAQDVAGLATEPTALLDQVRDRVGGAPSQRAGGMLEYIGAALGAPGATPELRAALYQAAKRIPGVEFLGRTTDRTGRSGVAVGLVADSAAGRTRYSLIFDPRTAEVLATEATVLGAAGGAGAKPVLSDTTVYQTKGT